MISLVPPSIIILPLALLVVFYLNKRHERKIKDSFEEIADPDIGDQLFDLPKAKQPHTPRQHEPYIPPQHGQSRGKDDLSQNPQLNSLIETAKTNLKRPVKKNLDLPASQQGDSQPALTQAQKLKRVQMLKAQLARVQAQKRRLKNQQNSGRINQGAHGTLNKAV